MKAKNTAEAWTMANEIFPTDYMKDSSRSEAAGYDIYFTTAAGKNAWISDLNDRLELNMDDGRTINIWSENKVTCTEYELADALRAIDDAIYHIEDEIGTRLQKATGIDAAKKMLWEAYGKLGEILKEQHPGSELIKMYHFDEE